MQHLNRRQFLETSLLAAGAIACSPSRGYSAVVPGVETVASPLITGEERNAQPDMWALELNYKPVRMIEVDIPDPVTGQTTREFVWYLAYRAVVRNSSQVPDSPDHPEDRPLLVPEFVLVTEDEGKMQSYPDRILPMAQAAINKRERQKYKNAVEIVAPLPPLTRDRAKILNSLDGVAMWKGIDSETDFFSIYMLGFSNGYQVGKGPEGQEVVLRRTLVQRFWRPSDRFDQNEEEIRLKDDPKWIYR